MAAVPKTEKIRGKIVPYVRITDVSFMLKYGTILPKNSLMEWLFRHNAIRIALIVAIIAISFASLASGIFGILAFSVTFLIAITCIITIERTNARKSKLYNTFLEQGGTIVAPVNKAFLGYSLFHDLSVGNLHRSCARVHLVPIDKQGC